MTGETPWLLLGLAGGVIGSPLVRDAALGAAAIGVARLAWLARLVHRRARPWIERKRTKRGY